MKGMTNTALDIIVNVPRVTYDNVLKFHIRVSKVGL